MELFKKILIYIAVILAIVIFIGLIIFALMYFSPKTKVFGFEYLKYDQEINYNYTPSSTDWSTENIEAVEIQTDISDVYIYPNGLSKNIIIEQYRNYSGFVKTINETVVTDIEVKNKSFEEDDSSIEYNTFYIKLTEPSGWIRKNKSYIKIYLSNNFNLNTIYVKSNSANIYFISEQDENIVSCENLYLKTKSSGKLFISNNQAIENYYLETGSGEIDFNNINSLTANTIKLTSDSSYFRIPVINSDIVVNSYNEKNGPKIDIDKLVGNLTVNAIRGTYIVDQVGEEGNYKQVNMTLTKSHSVFDKLFGNAFINSGDTKVNNKLNINILKSNSGNSVFEIGSGDATISDVQANVCFDSTTGNINLQKIGYEHSAYVYSTSGNIDIDYVYDNGNNTNTKCTVITKTGNINLNNVSCYFVVKVLSNSSKKNLNINLASISVNNASDVRDNIIEARDRVVNLKLVNIVDGDFKQFRLLTNENANLIETTGSIIDELDDDFLNDSYYDDFLKQYRVGYSKENLNNNFEILGKILILTAKEINVRSRITN